MNTAAAPPPIAGSPVDPPPASVAALVEKIDQRSRVAGIGYRVMRRYSHANAGLLASGTAYFMFLSLFSLLAFAYGAIAFVGADELAATLTEAVSEALPGLVGEEGIDPEQLRSTGKAAGVVGLVMLLYSGLGAVGGASSSLHLIFGAPPDPRNFVRAKLRHAGILLAVAPLMVLSFAATSVTSELAQPLLELVGLDSGIALRMVSVAAFLLGFAADVLIIWVLIGHLGGIRPHRRPRLIASLVGGVAIGLIKALLEAIVAWSLAKPQYGAFAAPLAVLFVLSLLATVLYASGAIAAGISDRDVPLADLPPTPVDTVG
ncbi:MAG: YihY/virulence factor BrkB family protein [Candidatus Nanopelagicales bacterium]